MSGYLWTATSATIFSLSLSRFTFYFHFFSLFFLFFPLPPSPILPALWKFNSTGRGGRGGRARVWGWYRNCAPLHRKFRDKSCAAACTEVRGNAPLCLDERRWKLLLTTTNISRARIFAYNSVWFNRSPVAAFDFSDKCMYTYMYMYILIYVCKTSSSWKKRGGIVGLIDLN